MGKLHWYKRDPDAALAGMAELTLAERGAYNSIIDLLYSRGGNVPDDDVLVARMIGCHWREWRAMKARLIARGKVRLEGGKITANRVQEALKEAADFSQDQRKRAAKRWHNPENVRENNDPDMPAGNANTTTTTTTPTPTDMSVVASARARVRAELEAAWPRLGNDMADIKIYTSMPMVDGWIGDGADLDADVLPTVRRISAQMVAKGQGPPKSLKYFAQAVADSLATRKQVLPSGHVKPPSRTSQPEHRDGWAALATSFIRQGNGE